MHILMIFIDGIGLGDDDPKINPFASAHMPNLMALTNGQRWLRGIGRQESDRAVFVPTDPRLGLPGRPQSATGQATIITGRNIPALIGEHYGPRPNQAIRDLISEDNIFKRVVERNGKTALVNAYPPQFHEVIDSGKRLRSSYQHALHELGIPLYTKESIYSGDAFAMDWTNRAWRDELGYADAPVYTPHEAGVKLAELSRRYDFAFFSHWLSDFVGHRGPFESGVYILELFDGVMSGLLDAWDDDEGLIIVTSDHGNMEDLSHGKHTENDVPTLIIGSEKAHFADGLRQLTDLTPRMSELLFRVQ